MANPYTRSMPPTPPEPDARPLHKRKRVWLGGASLVILGALMVGVGNGAEQPTKDSARPAATVTATVTSSPAPAPTVTETIKAKRKPAPTVTVTKTATARPAGGTTDRDTAGGTDSGSRDTAGSTGTCSIVSSSGNCYSAGQFCRNADHGSVTTTASGARIKCTYRSNAWRWSYA